MRRVWTWKPQWHWHGWSALSPIHFGVDERCHRTVVIGWTVTGRLLVALWRVCGDDCDARETRR